MFWKKIIRNKILDYYPKLLVNNEWKHQGKVFDWDHPKDLNEKILWLLYCTDTSKWTELADKYKVREYVKQCGLGDLLIPLLGKWDRAEDIDYDSLPDKFVLKCNHDSGSTHIIDKTKEFDKDAINAELNKHLKQNYAYVHGEMHYKNIKPCIIAENLLEQGECNFSTSLIDYKIWCFNGKPYIIWACYSRSKECVYVNFYDFDWNVHPEYSVFDCHYRNGKGKLPRPQKLKEMLLAASKLSDGFPQVRVDFYETNGILYFGEMTFTSERGRMSYFTESFLKELGNQVILPKGGK